MARKTDFKITSEHQEQVRFLHWLSMYLPDYHERTAAAVNGAQSSQGAKLKAEGMSAGYPDLLVEKPRSIYHGLRIEMKKVYGEKRSPEQIVWHDRLEEDKYAVVTAHGTVDAFIKTVAYQACKLSDMVFIQDQHEIWLLDRPGFHTLCRGLPQPIVARHQYYAYKAHGLVYDPAEK